MIAVIVLLGLVGAAALVLACALDERPYPQTTVARLVPPDRRVTVNHPSIGRHRR